MNNEDKNIKKYLKKLSKKYELKACYEASCNGYTFQRKMKEGYHCDVIAPSLMPKKPGDHRKNDFRDARNLVQTYSNGQLTIVNPPTEEQESIRNLIRCRLNLKDEEKSAKLQINSFLLNMGISWHKSKWTIAHRTWLSKRELRDDYSQKVLSEYVDI